MGFNQTFRHPVRTQWTQEELKARAAKAATKAPSTPRTPSNADAELAAWLNDQTWSSFALSLARYYTRKGRLSPKQRAAALSMRAKCEARAAKKKAAGPAAPAPEPGFYFAEGEWYRVKENRAGTNVYAARWGQAKHQGGDHHVWDGPRTYRDSRGRVHEYPTHDDDPYIPIAEPTWTWIYEGRKPFDKLTPDTLVDAELAAKFGHAFGRCLNCSAPLTDPASVERGMGPTCAKKFSKKEVA